MPRGKEDWSLGKIYKIISNNPDVNEVYYGSTCQRLLSSRMSGHRANYKQWISGKNGKCSSFDLFEKYGVEQFHIELVEDYPCENGEQLHTQENIYIRGNECVNKNSAIDKYNNKQEYDREHYQLHKEEKKQYYQDNKEKLVIYKKEYYQNNKDEINKPITCECGCKILTMNMYRHLKTKKHKSLINV